MNQPHSLQPSLVGRFWTDGEVTFLPLSRPDLTRAIDAGVRTIATFDFPRGRFALVIQLGEDAGQMAPMEDAFSELGFIINNADNSVFDAYRTEAIIRRFDPAAIIGLSGAVLDGLAELGHDAGRLLKGRVVWARPDAFARIKDLPEVTARLWTTIGPAVAMGCAVGRGAHVDGREWAVTSEDGKLSVTSRLPRAKAFNGYATGVEGQVEEAPCTCGLTDPLVTLKL